MEVPRRDTLHDPVINTTVTLILPMKLLKDVDTWFKTRNPITNATNDKIWLSYTSSQDLGV